MTPPPTVTYAGAQVKRRPGRGALGVAAGGVGAPPSNSSPGRGAIAHACGSIGPSLLCSSKRILASEMKNTKMREASPHDPPMRKQRS